MSEWLLFDTKWANFSYIIREQITFRWDDVWFVLDQIFIELAHWNNSSQIDMLFHSDTLSWFQLNQSLLLLCILNAEAANTNFIVFGLTWPNTRSTTFHWPDQTHDLPHSIDLTKHTIYRIPLYWSLIEYL